MSSRREDAYEWRKLRTSLLNTLEGCEVCGVALKDDGSDAELDHIKPWIDYPDLRLDPNNVRWLCKPCHWKRKSETKEERKSYFNRYWVK